jgi:LAO/AO transport system kinase
MPPVVTYSALAETGIAELWDQVLTHRERLTASGEMAARRRDQQVKWMWSMLEERLFAKLRTDPAVRAKLPRIETAVAEGKLSPVVAVEEIAAALNG